MNFRRSDGAERPADRAEAERLLDAARTADAPPAGDDPLARLLSAAPPRPARVSWPARRPRWPRSGPPA